MPQCSGQGLRGGGKARHVPVAVPCVIFHKPVRRLADLTAVEHSESLSVHRPVPASSPVSLRACSMFARSQNCLLIHGASISISPGGCWRLEGSREAGGSCEQRGDQMKGTTQWKFVCGVRQTQTNT